MITSTRKGRLSPTDRKILKILLAPDANGSAHIAVSASSDGAIASELGKSLNLVKARRTILERDLLQRNYFMNVERMGFRRVDFLIATERGLADSIAKNLTKVREVVRVSHSIGEPTIDLRVELIVKDNGELMELLERVKAMNGVRDVVWSEIVKVACDKGSVPAEVIDVF